MSHFALNQLALSHLSFNRLAIRWRLTIAYASFVLLLMAGLSVVILYRVHHHLLARADLALWEESNELIEELDRSESRTAFLVELDKRFDTHQHYYFQILSESNERIFQSRFLTGLELPQPFVSPSQMRGKRFSDFEIKAIGRYRLLDMAVRDAEDHPLLIRTMSSRDWLDKDFRSYVSMFVTVIPLALIFSTVTGYFVAGRMLSPVKELVQTAEKISANQIDQRLPVINRHDELGELSVALNSTFDRLEKAMEAIRNFTSDAAHELRSPLAVLRTEAEIALRRDRTVEELRAVVLTTLAETRRLGDIVEQLLALGRHDAGIQPMLNDEVPISAVIEDVIARLTPVANAKQIELQARDLPRVFVLGNDVWLSQLFANLVDNAIKFTQSGGRVCVSGKVMDGWLNIRVDDTGVGLSPGQLEHVFERFYRADPSREHNKGSGLGLAICKSIVESHSGTISVTSQSGQGATFLVRFPIANLIDDSHDEELLEGAEK